MMLSSLLLAPGILGIVAANTSVWVSPRRDYSVIHLYKHISRLLGRGEFPD